MAPGFSRVEAKWGLSKVEEAIEETGLQVRRERNRNQMVNTVKLKKKKNKKRSGILFPFWFDRYMIYLDRLRLSESKSSRKPKK